MNRRRTFLAAVALTTLALAGICVAFGSPLPLLIVPLFLALLVAAGLVYVVGGIVCIGALAFVGTWIFSLVGAYRLTRSLPTARKITWTELSRMVSTNPGSLILESRSIGWNVANIWWTPRNIPSDAAAAGISTEGPDAEKGGSYLVPDAITPFCVTQYLHPEHGDALLIHKHLNPWTGRRLKRLLDDFQAANPRTPVQWISPPLHKMLRENGSSTAKPIWCD